MSSGRGEVVGGIRRARRSARRGAATRFLLAAGISTYGDWLTTVALLVLLFRLTGTATAPAIYILARSAPRVLGPGPGGALADRIGASRVAAVCSGLQALCTASIVVLATASVVWAVYVAVAASQFLGAMAQPAVAATIPQVVRHEQLGRVNAVYQAILESCILVAPALGALLLLLGIRPEALVIGDAASFVLAAALLATLHTRARSVLSTEHGTGMLAGIAVVRRSSVLRMLTAGHLANAFAVTALQAVLVVAASQRFGHDTDVGWLYAAVGGGGLLGSVALLRRPPVRVQSRHITLAVFGELIPLGVFAIAPSLALGCALLFVSAVAAALYQTEGAVGLQQTVPPALLGRVNAVVRFALYVGMLLGAVVAATTLAWLSWDRLLVCCTAVSAAVLVLTVLTQPGTEAHPAAARGGPASLREPVRPEL
jgi:MFS family permease